MQRRQLLRGAVVATSTAALTACARGLIVAETPSPALRLRADTDELVPIKAKTDRISGVYVCTRPFRAAGPRIEIERIGRKIVVHNYGHGGAGWSLSWGAATLALELVQTVGARELGVIGCGAIGLTTALLAQRAGLAVRIYAKQLPPDVASMRASGIWSPDSRICDAVHADAFASRWEAMTRTSHRIYQSLLGLPGDPVEWIEGYALSDTPFGQPHSPAPDEPEYPSLHRLVRDLTPRGVELEPGTHPFPQRYVRRYTTMMFNIGAYAHLLFSDFLATGGKVEVREFATPAELDALPESAIVNATGYGARALFDDESVIPVRGQTARLVPQREVRYGLALRDLSVVPRSDGILVQRLSDRGNFNNADTTPDRAAAEAAVNQLGELMRQLRR